VILYWVDIQYLEESVERPVGAEKGLYIVSKVILSVFLILFISSPGAEIYKWVDETGTTHYGECPPAECKSERVETLPGPSAKEIRRARERTEQLTHELKQNATATIPGKQAKEGVARQDWAAECLSDAAHVIGPARADPGRPVSPRVLTSVDYKKLQRILRTLKGRWRGYIDEVLCLGIEGAPRDEARRYEVDATVEHDLDDIVTFEAEVMNADYRSRQLQILWLLLKKERLRFGDMETIKHDAPQWDVELISIDKDSLMFMRKFRRAGHRSTSLQHIELRSLHTSRKVFTLKEWFYIQGTLTRMRTWTLQRLP
jgi:hypothetical protein